MCQLLSQVIFLILCVVICVTSADRNFQTLKRQKRFISFDSKDGKIDVDLEFSVPFISIPLQHEGTSDDDQAPKPLANINLKALTFAAFLTTISTLIIPLFFKPHHNMEHRYRRSDELGLPEIGRTINELLFGNNYVTPCIEQFVCNAVARANRVDDPTSSEKILEGITNLGWFKNITNGTSINEAIRVGRLQHAPCTVIYKTCKIPDDVFKALMNELGLN